MFNSVAVHQKRYTLSYWCSLLRLPNLLTVPGDPVAGGILAAATVGVAPDWNVIRSAALASLCLYSAGLLANDYFDRHQDARERPDRPLPSGKIKPNPVLGCAAILTALAFFFAAQAGRYAVAFALLIALASWSYNLGMKRLPVFGPLLMGSCRAMSLLLGAAATAPSSILSQSIIIPAATLGLLITSITSIARRETESIRLPLWQISLPPAILLIGLTAIIIPHLSATLPAVAGCGLDYLFTINHLPIPSTFTLLLATMPVIWITLLSAQLSGKTSPALVQRNIGGMIRGLILFQAALCASAGGHGEVAALVILAAFPVAGWLGKLFYGS